MKKRRKGLLGLLLAGVLALTACGSGGTADTVVLKIDNHDITKYEYMVYLYTTTQSFVSAAGEDVWNLDFDGQTAVGGGAHHQHIAECACGGGICRGA